MASVQSDLDQIVKGLRLYHFTQELESSKQQLDNPRIEKLETILSNLTHKNHSVKDEFFHKMDTIVYRNNWRKLPDFHKTVKLKEFIKENYEDYQDVLEKLLLKNPDLNSEKSVEYDSTLMKITNILILKFNEETKVFSLSKKK
jgi:hypothetical protein